MPDLLEHMYCSQQINIPPNLPFILKQYAKAAIRTQPYDLLYWSAAYFRAKANNSPPPVKERLEYPPVNTPSRLSPGFLKVLHKQLGENEYVPEEVLVEKWLGVCLVQDALESMLRVGSIQDKVPWHKFVAIAAGHLCANLRKTMVMVCEVMTEEPEGGSAMIPVEVFVDLYQYLARLDCGPPKQPTVTEPESETIFSCTSKSSAASTKEIMETTVIPTNTKDSHAGLMVWEDVHPEKPKDRKPSPKYTEELGASSQQGLEVYDEATGPVTEIVTLFSAQPQAEGQLYDEIENELPEYDTTERANTGENEVAEELKTQKDSEENGIKPSEEENKIEDITEENPNEMKKSVENEKFIHEKEELLSKTSEQSRNEEDEIKEIEEDVKYASTHDLNKSVPSENSVTELGESVTVQNFITANSKESIVSYSTEEIRKGYYNDKSGSKLERASSENTVKAAETVLPFDTVAKPSSDFLDQEKSAEKNFRKSESLSDQESDNCTELPPLKKWMDVPGIGPVIPEPQIIAVVEYMHYWANKQQGMVMPRNVNHILCPPLHLPPFNESTY